MKSFATVCVLSGAVLMGAVRILTAAETAPATPPATQPVAFNKFCAVETADAVDPAVTTVVYNGKTVGFCCSGCIEKFKKDPEKYMSKAK